MIRLNLIPVIEGMLFIVGEDGLTSERIKEVLDIDDERLDQLLTQLHHIYENENRGIRLEVLGNRLKLTTKKEHKEYYERLTEVTEENVLSQAALETLAIIAYNQPITRLSVDEIRGINSGHMIRKLVSQNLVEEVGRSDTPGRPILYGVTKEFLDYFGLADIKDLPPLEDTKETIEEEKDLFESKYKEVTENIE